MQITGLQKTTLLDYPGHLAATLFLEGCNFRCPFCHNKELVLQNAGHPSYTINEVLSYLKKRQGILDGVCISGGEPTLADGLIDLIMDIKKLSYLVKLDTNGSNPKPVQYLLNQNAIDYIAMDIKTDKEHYKDITNCPALKTEDIEQTIASIKSSAIPYEFRTTVVEELHNKNTFRSIGEWIGDCHLYALQPYEDSENVLVPGFHTPQKDALYTYRNILADKMHNVIIRGLE